MSKLVSDLPFGGILSSKMKIGDLVSWAEWMIADNSLIEEVFYGTIVEKLTKIEGNRPICIIMVACSKTGEVLSLNPFQLRLEETI
jgi:hypothetical protein